MVLSDPIPNVHVIGIYRSKTYVKFSNLIDALNHRHSSKLTDSSIPVVLLGDFNVNLMEGSYKMFNQRKRIYTVD